MQSQAVRDVFDQRKDEIDNFFKLLYKVDKLGASIATNDGATERFSIQTYTSLKSSSILLLYNLVEAVMSITLEVMHERICSSELKYTELNEKLKEIMLAYYIKAIDHGGSDHTKTVQHIKELIALSVSAKAFNLSYTDMSKYYALYSGNLDAKVIKKILSHYGISLDNNCTELKTIREKRNSLAHGNESFEECGRSMTYEQLIALKDRSFLFLEEMMLSVEEYLSNEKFMAET